MNEEFFRLLNESNTLKKKNRYLQKENPESFRVLLTCLATIEVNLHYFERQKYINLVKDFLADQITAEDFSYSFIALNERINQKLGRMKKNESSDLAKFLSKTRKRELGRLLARVYGSCDSFSLDPEISMCSEDELKNDAQDLLIMLENRFSMKLDETQLNQIEDIYNANIEVFVTLEDGFSVTIIVGTPENLKSLMEKDNRNFYGPGLPWIIVQKLTKEIIHEAIKAYIDARPDGYWLKLYHFAPNIDIAVLNQLQAQEIQKLVQSNLLIGVDELRAKIKKLDQLDQSTKLDLVNSLHPFYKHIAMIDQK